MTPSVESVLAAARAATGFMPDDEGDFLHRVATDRLPHGPALEIGGYCGKSALHLAAAALAQAPAGTVFSLDHHRGSEENQAGWEHHDPDLVDPESGLMDTLPIFRRTIQRAGVEPLVVALVGRSVIVSTHWRTPVSLVFIDGGHAEEHAQADYAGFAPWVLPDGALVVHDVFEDPADGGQAPFHVWQRAVDSGSFTPVETVGSMRWLRRTSGDPGDPVG